MVSEGGICKYRKTPGQCVWIQACKWIQTDMQVDPEPDMRMDPNPDIQMDPNPGIQVDPDPDM